MALNSEQKSEIVVEYRRSSSDTGSAEVQVALLTERIKELTQHMQIHNKDHSSRRGLIMLVNQRRRMLEYLDGKDHGRYKTLIGRLGLRR